MRVAVHGQSAVTCRPQSPPRPVTRVLGQGLPWQAMGCGCGARGRCCAACGPCSRHRGVSSHCAPSSCCGSCTPTISAAGKPVKACPQEDERCRQHKPGPTGLQASPWVLQVMAKPAAGCLPSSWTRPGRPCGSWAAHPGHTCACRGRPCGRGWGCDAASGRAGRAPSPAPASPHVRPLAVRPWPAPPPPARRAGAWRHPCGWRA